LVKVKAEGIMMESVEVRCIAGPDANGIAEQEGVPAPGEDVGEVPVLLLVDDEPSILSALRRVLRTRRYDVLTAESAATALELLASTEVDLIISDMRMPIMSGAEFLARAQMLYPDTMRILLTGYSEIDSVVQAINEGGVYRYLSKPWNDQDLLLTVAQALEQRHLRKETVRLTALTQKQNEQLREFNTSLETQVQARTEEIRQTVMFLEDAQQDLKRNFTTMVQACASMIELRCGISGGQSLRVGETARHLALSFGMSMTQAQDLFFAGLLHGIGKLSLPDELVREPIERMSPAESELFHRHPLRAQLVLTPVAQLIQVAQIIRHQYERFNGHGVPDRLPGAEIPLESRILAVARDYEELLRGGIAKHPVSSQQAMGLLQTQSGLRYDPDVVDHFVTLMKNSAAQGLQTPVSRINGAQLEEGMRRVDDLRNARGVLLMSKDSVVSAHQADQLRRYEQQEAAPFSILVHASSASAARSRSVQR
jgi:adenylate cyclase